MREDSIKISVVIIVSIAILMTLAIYALIWHTAPCEKFKGGVLSVGAAPARCLE